MRKAAPIALIAGLAIGIVGGALTTRKIEKQETVTAVSSSSDVQEVSVSSSAGDGVEEDVYDPEQYEIFLEESAHNKSVEASDVDFLDVASETYAKIVNQSYPRHSYNVAMFKTDENGQRSYDSDKYTSRCGIDVSEFNGEIDWQQVADAGFEFAFVRLGYRGYGTDGALHLDARFEENLYGASAAGLDVGVYFFAQAITEEEAVEEAEFVVEHLAGFDLQLPVVYDPEAIQHDKARTDEVTGRQITTNAAYFCNEIEKAGYEAGYYANLKWEIFMLDMSTLSDYMVWYAGYETTPRTPYAFDFWQYSDKGKVPGISENTDLDIQMIPIGE